LNAQKAAPPQTAATNASASDRCVCVCVFVCALLICVLSYTIPRTTHFTQYIGKLAVRKTGERGSGLFSRTPIPAGSLVIEYCGEVISSRMCTERAVFYGEQVCVCVCMCV
jgi:hypothetical protein